MFVEKQYVKQQKWNKMQIFKQYKILLFLNETLSTIGKQLINFQISVFLDDSPSHKLQNLFTELSKCKDLYPWMAIASITAQIFPPKRLFTRRRETSNKMFFTPIGAFLLLTRGWHHMSKVQCTKFVCLFVFMTANYPHEGYMAL